MQSGFERGVLPIRVVSPSRLLNGLGKKIKVWMKHSDEVITLPPGFKLIGTGDQTVVAIMADEKRHWYGVQFHPEAGPNPAGKRLYYNFILTLTNQNRFSSDRAPKVGPSKYIDF